ncbi:MAG TPA: ornithine cyclodeaminase family protein [Beijerinckiaceae bacterium]|nr:ornithine cyclodeaminase family protein [Beijerinckiaceae bacterium]
MSMTQLNAEDVRRRLPWDRLIGAIEAQFSEGAQVPPRPVFDVANPKGQAGALLLMPAWTEGETLGVKVVTFFPGNSELGLSTISAAYLLFDAATGQIRAVCDGDEITVRRTAATSAAAARRLARSDAKRLLVVGSGQLAPNMAEAHAAVRGYDVIEIFGRSRDKAAAVVSRLVRAGLPARVADDLEASVRAADVVSCCTSATVPPVQGTWLRPGTHVDLVGGFRDDMREVDDTAVARASLFVDERPGALKSGDLAQPIRAGLLRESDIRADFRELVTGSHVGRTSAQEITLFKSVGHGLEDLAAGRMIARTL